MAASRSEKSKVAVRISVPKGWTSIAKRARDRVTARLAAYVDDLLECLELPAEVALELEQRATLPVDVVRIATDCGELRVSPGGLCVADADTWTDADEAFMGVARALFCARELLLTDDLVDRTWKQLPNPSRIRDAKLRRWMLCECARYGIGNSLLAEVLSGSTVRAKSRQEACRLFEDCARDLPGTVRLRLSHSLHELCRGDPEPASGRPGPAETEEKSFTEAMETIVDAIFFETGVHPALLSPASDPDLEEGWFQVQINSMPLPPTRGLEAEQLLVDCAPAELLALDVEADPFRSPVSGRMVALVTDAEDREAVGASGHQSWGPIGYVALHLAIAMRKNLGALYTKAKWIFYALQLRLVLPELVDHVMNTWDARDLSRILRYLLDEGIGIRDMRSILEMLAEPREITPMDLSKYIVFTLAGGAPVPDSYVLDGRQITAGAMGEMARNALKRSISYHYALGGNSLELYLVDHGAEKVISGPEFQDPLGPAARRYASKFRDEVRKEVGFVAPHGRKPVILTTAAVRRRVRELVRLEFPDLHVLSYQELSPDMDLQPLARIKVA